LVTELQKKGFTNSFALLGGTRAWIAAGYPLNKPGEPPQSSRQ
jgi:rhodanese-related sulfurtransferase